MPIVETTSRTGIDTPDWDKMAETARLILAQDPSPQEWLVATAHLCAAAKAKGRPDEAAAAAAALTAALARHGLILKTAVARFGAAEAAIAILTAAGDLAAARNYFQRIFLREAEPLDEIVISDTAEIADWAVSRNLPFTVIEPESRILLEAEARGLSPPEYTAAPFVSAVVPGGEIYSGWDFARTPEGIVLGMGASDFYGVSSPPFFHFYSQLARTAVHYWPREVVEIPEAALFLPAPFKMHVGHWIVDGLPRLQALAGHPDFKVAVPAKLPRSNREFLSQFGITPDRVIDCKMGARYRFRELLVAQYDSSVRPSPGKIRFMADHLRKARTAAAAPRRVFVVRGVPTRHPVNEDEVHRTLEAFGFVAVNLMTMSNTEQRDCFAAADIVVTTYGSDLLVCYFMQPGTDLIEFNWNIAFDGPGAPACAFIGIDYHLLMCQPVEREAKVNKKDSDFLVDCAVLRRLLERIIAAKA